MGGSQTRFIQDGLLGLFDKSSWPPIAAGVPPAPWNSRRAHQCRRPHARDVAIAMAAVPKTDPDITRSYVRSISETGLTVRSTIDRSV
jgi:hypothetical protein